MALTVCPETSVINYQSTLRNIPEERRPYTEAEGKNVGILSLEGRSGCFGEGRNAFAHARK